MLDHSSYYCKCKLNPLHRGFFQSKLSIINVVSYLDFTTPLVFSQHQVDAIYCDLRSAFDLVPLTFLVHFDLVPHTFLVHKLSACGFSDA
jgi:hypothetical protein